jgi:hypothetical protein
LGKYITESGPRSRLHRHGYKIILREALKVVASKIFPR